MHVVVCGAGPAGSAVALLLAAEGHRVTVLDRRPGADPALGTSTRAPAGGPAGGAAGAADGPHLLLLREALRLLSYELPGVARELLSVGAVTGTSANVVATRAAVVSAWAVELARTESVRTSHGAGVAALLTGEERTPGRPHVSGVVTDTGATILGDLVVDATGRDSRMLAMLDEIGALRPSEELQDTRFRLYTRHFMAPPGTHTNRAGWSVHHFDGVRVAVLSAGGRTWSMTLSVDDEDQELRPLAAASTWARAAALYKPLLPRQFGNPLSGVQVVSRAENCYRRLALGRRSVATGLVSVGDAWAVTDPLLGLGPSMSVLHAVLLREAVRDGGPLDEVAVRFARLTERNLTPVHQHIADWERRRRTQRGWQPGRPSATVAYGPQGGVADLVRGLRDHFSAMTLRAADTSLTGPSRADLLAAITPVRTTW